MKHAMNPTSLMRDDGTNKADCRSPKGGGGVSIPASSLTFCVGEVEEVKSLVLKYHYSHRFAANVQVVTSLHEPGGLFGNKGKAACGAVFSLPPTRWSEEVLELSRLVRRNDVKPPLSMLLSLSCAWIRKHTHHDLIVSFADKTQGHTGTVYKASGWVFVCERRPGVDGVYVDGKFVPGRTCNSLWGTRSPQKLALLMPKARIEPHVDCGKLLFAKPLNGAGERKLLRLFPDVDGTREKT